MYNGQSRPKKLPVYVSEDEFTELLKATPQKKHRIAFLLAWGAGLRISEVLKLKPEQVDIKERRITVLEGKGMKDRVVPLPKGFKEEHLAFLPFDTKDRNVQKQFRRSAELSGLKAKKPSVHFHSLRHGFAVQCLKKRISLPAIKGMMGHSDLSTTGIYLELTPEDRLNEYMEKF